MAGTKTLHRLEKKFSFFAAKARRDDGKNSAGDETNQKRN